MTANDDGGLLLGKHTPVVEEYSPGLLFPIPRIEARQRLGLEDALPFYGTDLWHAYELSWLQAEGRPVARVGRFHIPASTPYMVESKSFKLYLNSLNNTRFGSDEEARATIEADIGKATGGDITLELLDVQDQSLSGAALQGDCLDELELAVTSTEPTAGMLQVDSGNIIEDCVYSHLLRSLCPVTGQPDWATVWVHYRGAAIDRHSLLAYIIAYRQHQEYHEQCVERMFRDLNSRIQPGFLHIQAFYTRRGGMDINPMRSTDPEMAPLPRLNRQ